jgi:DNA-binding NtrC family response regulator
MTPATILVVDDEQLLRWALKKRLEKDGYRVLEAGSRTEATQKFCGRESVSLVLLDLHLPDGDGLEMLRDIKGRCPQCHVIVMTAKYTPESVLEATRLGAFRSVEKPFSLDEIARLVRTALRPGKVA